VVEHYRARGLPNHARALEAVEALAESMLTRYLWEAGPGKSSWESAEAELHELHNRYRSSHGDTNQFTLAAAVAHTYALVPLGRRDEGRAALATLLPALARQLGQRHQLHLRALLLSGLIHAHLQEYAGARPLFERALAGQRAILGYPPRPHPAYSV
jgi:hypothetical protein